MRDIISDPFPRVFSVIALVLAGACQSIGPSSVQRDRLDYADAIASSWREQTLINIVKLRYFDAPVFLEVSSVIGSYTLQGEVRLDARTFPSNQGGTYRNLGATGTYTDHPTISYTPVTGQKYIDKLLRPIPPQAVFAMIQAGHPADYILSLTVRGMNDVFNSSTGPARNRAEDPAFIELIDALRRIQLANALGIRTEKRGKEETSVVFFRQAAAPDVEKDIRVVKEKLGIASDITEMQLTYGTARRGRDEIALLTRSMWEILAELSSGVEVPQQDASQGRAIASQETVKASAVRIRSGDERPPDAYVAAHYRDHWFWIDDRDLASKRVFAFLTVFSSIAETGAVPQVPIITIPAN